ncbi:MAG: hypothetical protein AMXMBFR6_19610 [Betaproteobacteria bacterium]|nr:outer membrane lipoprotein chaperone LolA [Rhodocyclaceae bacterium]
MRKVVVLAVRRAAVMLSGLVVFSPAIGATALDDLREWLVGTRSVRADFDQTVSGMGGRSAKHAAGSMSILRPGKFRWRYREPYEQLIVGDGTRVWIYDRDLNQVSVRRQSQALASSPAALLAGPLADTAQLQRDFDIREDAADAGPRWLTLVPRNADSGFTRVRLALADKVLHAMELTDSFGQVTLLRFSHWEQNAAIDAREFRFTPPAGADVLEN